MSTCTACRDLTDLMGPDQPLQQPPLTQPPSAEVFDEPDLSAMSYLPVPLVNGN
jgi:hypothetical protein